MVFKLVWGLVLSCCRRKVVFLSGLTGNSGLQLSQRRDVSVRVDGLSGYQEIQEDNAFTIPKDSAHRFTLYPLMAASWTFPLMGNSHVATPWTVILIPAHNGDTMFRHRWWCSPGNCHLQLHSGSAGPERLAFLALMFLCEHPWAPPGTNFAIFQHCQHRFQLIEADIQLRTWFPGCNPAIRMDELIEVLSISWADKVACLSHRCRHCWNAPLTASLCWHPLFGLHKRTMSVV
jgi:hypothetical protein